MGTKDAISQHRRALRKRLWEILEAASVQGEASGKSQAKAELEEGVELEITWIVVALKKMGDRTFDTCDTCGRIIPATCTVLPCRTTCVRCRNGVGQREPIQSYAESLLSQITLTWEKKTILRLRSEDNGDPANGSPPGRGVGN